MSKKYGSFDVDIYNQDETTDEKFKTYTVNPLTQHEISNGWRLVLPNRKMVNRIVKNKDGDEINVNKSNDCFFKVNLAQLPPHMFNRLKRVYKNDQFVHIFVLI